MYLFTSLQNKYASVGKQTDFGILSGILVNHLPLNR